MKRVSAYLGAVATGLLGLSQTAQAELINVTIDAGVRTSNTEGQCLFPVPVFTSNDCSYNDTATYGNTNWIGPGYTGAFYAIGAAPLEYVNEPQGPGDGRIGAPLSGTITIDNKDAPAACSTHSISGVILMGPFSRNYQTQANVRLIDNYPNGIEQTIADRVVDAGTANGAGGCDYVLGAAGAPSLLTTGTDVFPGQTAYAISTAGGAGTTSWQVPTPGSPGLTPGGTGIGEGNQGHTAVATEVGGLTDAGFTCSSASGPCTPGTLTWNTAARAGWDNIVGTISTNAAGNITGTQLFFVHQITVVSPGNNSWLAYTANITGTGPGGAAPAAVDDSASGFQDSPLVIDVLANDTDFTDPVTVTKTDGTNGTVTVNGSPGNQAAVDVTYTPNSGFFGTDTFTYTVVDNNAATDTATVTVTIAEVGANDDSATTRLNTPVVINVLTNDVGFTNPVTVTKTDGTNGTVTVNGSPGAQAAVNVTYTPDTGFSGVDTFTYTVSDGNAPDDTATVTVTVTNAVPTAAPGTINSITTGGFDPSTRTGTFNAATGNNLGDAPSVVTASGATTGSVSVSGTTVTYTPNATFFQGTDTFSYTITDDDDETATNTVTVTIADASPTVANGSDTGDQDTVLNAKWRLHRRQRLGRPAHAGRPDAGHQRQLRGDGERRQHCRRLHAERGLRGRRLLRRAADRR